MCNFFWNRKSSVSLVSRLRAGLPGFDSRHGQALFILATTFRPPLGTTQIPIQWIPGHSLPGNKASRAQADHLHPSGAEVKNAWSYTSIPPYVFMAWCLVKYRSDFTLILQECTISSDMFTCFGSFWTPYQLLNLCSYK
jgi:hypothetical protein